MSFILFLLFLAVLLLYPPDAEGNDRFACEQGIKAVNQGIWHTLKYAKNNDHRDSKHNDRYST